jgi:1-acyl-sn-glycerol-3-phosphate acyltransferase
MDRLRSTIFDVLLAFWTVSFAFGILVFWLCGSPHRHIRAATRLWVRGALLGLRYVVGLRYTERGRELIPPQPCLIISNHQSTWETLAFLVLFPDVAIVAKQELLRIPVFSWYLRKSQMVIIDRETGSRAVRALLKQSRKALHAGRSVLIFPEGTRMGIAGPIRFRRGVELLYAKLGVVVLPVVVNSGKFWGPDQPYKRGGTITVSYLPPISPGLAPAEFTRMAESLLEAERAKIS